MYIIDGPVVKQVNEYHPTAGYKRMVRKYNAALTDFDITRGEKLPMSIKEGKEEILCCQLKPTKGLIELAHIVCSTEIPYYLFMTEKEPIFHAGYNMTDDILTIDCCLEYVSQIHREPQEGFCRIRMIPNKGFDKLKNEMIRKYNQEKKPFFQNLKEILFSKPCK